MKIFQFLFIALLISVVSCNTGKKRGEGTSESSGPISLHPVNPHYFQYKGNTLALVTSAEHYGAVLNLDFDYRKYLETLAGEGMNYTRIFTGVYFEIYGESFGIRKNTLAPKKGRVITPWMSWEENGKAVYDLVKWNGAYFERLKDFMALAQEKDIIVEVTLFSSIYRDEHWDLSPQNPANNVNMDVPISRFDAQTDKSGELFNYQELFVRKMVGELNPFDNFFFEIQNEPWSDHAVPVYNIVNKEDLVKNDWQNKADFADEGAMAWQEKIAAVIEDEEGKLPKKHLIAQNYVNFRASIPEVKDNISIINFHYAWPEAVEWNYHYNRVLGFDESGFAGSGDKVYRRQAWQFMLSGGGLFNNLDYSFFPGFEDGTGQNNAPGGGSPALRKQLKHLSDFLHSFELEKLYPDYNCIVSAPGLIPYALSDPGNVYAIFLRATGTEKSRMNINTGEGVFKVTFLNTVTGKYSDPDTAMVKDGILSLDIDIPDGELAVKIERTS
ncbi:MAG: hypothetical protein K9J30_02620 [Bacteroidales bacterium]|nr:hypothetical protein [Bacteroidales bacterium]